MINILIIEDEDAAAARLLKELKNQNVDFELISIIKSVRAAIEWLDSGQPTDLIFMDIQLEDGLSFEIFKHASVSVPVIFTTAYDEYALQAFKVKGLDYLLKPINPNELKLALDGYFESRVGDNNRDYIEKLISLAQEFKTDNHRSSFLVDFRQKMLMVSTSDVAYIYVKERGVFLRKKDNKEYVIEFYLDILEKQLDPSKFYRANRQFLVARSAIQEIEPYFTGRLLLKIEPEPPVPVIISKEKATDFKRWADY
jgi:two-component system response regulator LytT